MEFRKRNGREKGKNFLIDRHPFIMVSEYVAQFYGIGMCSLLRLCLNPSKLLAVSRFFCKDLFSFIEEKVK